MSDHPMPPPKLSELDQLRADNESLRYSVERARWALMGDEAPDQRLMQAEIRAAVAGRDAQAYREQVQALVRSIQRERGVPEEELGGEFVIAVDKQPTASALPAVQGRCPACGSSSLFLGDGGYVTCPRIGCSEPDAASTLLASPQCTAETTHGHLPVRCVMPVRHDSTHADGSGVRWSDGFSVNPTSREAEAR